MAPPAAEAPGILALGNPDRIRRLLADAGLRLSRIEEVPIVFRFESADEYWSFLREIAGALAGAITALPPGRQGSVRHTIEDRLGPFRQGGGYALPGLCLNVAAN